MHEFTITSSLVDAVLDLARKQDCRQVLEVHLRIGKLRALSVEQVKFSYEVLVKGTILEGSKLHVEETPGLVRCTACGYTKEFDSEVGVAYHFGVPPLLCPVCGDSLTVVGGNDCVITKVRMLIPSGRNDKTRLGD